MHMISHLIGTAQIHQLLANMSLLAAIKGVRNENHATLMVTTILICSHGKRFHTLIYYLTQNNHSWIFSHHRLSLFLFLCMVHLQILGEHLKQYRSYSCITIYLNELGFVWLYIHFFVFNVASKCIGLVCNEFCKM